MQIIIESITKFKDEEIINLKKNKISFFKSEIYDIKNNKPNQIVGLINSRGKFKFN